MKKHLLPFLGAVILSLFSIQLLAQAPDSWTTKAILPVEGNRSAIIAFAIGGYGYMGLGTTSNGLQQDLWRYDPVANSWLQRANFPGGKRSAAICAVIDGKAYAGMGLGGIPGTPKQDFWEYDPSTNQWTQKASFPGDVLLYGSSAFALNGKMYMVGGYTYIDDQRKDVWEFDPILNQWTQKTDFPGAGRTQAGAFEMGGKGYICGGFLSGATTSNQFWEFDGLNWVQKANLLGSYGEPIAQSVNGYVYAGAGRTTRFIKYDFGTNTWTDVAAYPTPVMFGAGSFAIRNHIYVLGQNASASPTFRMYTTDCVGPTLTIEAPAKICYGEDAELVVSGGVTYNWGENAIFSAENGTRVVTPTVETTYTVTGTDAVGCVSTQSVTVGVTRLISTFQAPGSVCAPDVAQLLFTGSVPADTQFHWKLDSPGEVTTNADSTSLQVTWNATSTKNIKLITEFEGCLDSTSTTIAYLPRPNPDFAIPGGPLCQFDTLKLSYTGLMTDLFAWDFGGATIVSHKADSVYMLKWTSSGDKSITLDVSRDGCSSSSFELLSVTKTPSSQVTHSPLICHGVATQISYAGDGSGAATFEWAFDGANIESGSGSGPYQLTWNTFGQKDLSLKVTEDGCSSSSFELLSVTKTPTSQFSVAPLICESEVTELLYTGDGSSGATFEWDFAGAIIQSGSGQGPYQLSWNTFGQKDLSLKVTEDGCYSVSPGGLSVTKTPSSQFTVASLVCEGEVAQVSYTGNGTPSATFEWEFDGASIESGAGLGPYQLSWSTFGQKDLSLTVTEDGCSTSLVQAMSYNPKPAFTFEASGNICYSGTYLLTYTGQNNETVAWGFDGASILSGTGNGPYELDWDLSGEKSITALVSREGCSKDTVIHVTVGSEVFVPELCFVTITDDGTHNKLFWDYEHPESISKFGLYRESSIANQFELIEYIDPVAVNTYVDEASLPAQRSYMYAITAVDSCGVETIHGGPHQTMHLQVSGGTGNSFDLIWQEHEGVSFGTYRIKRKINDGNFDLLTEVSNNNHSFTDVPGNASRVSYQIEISVDAACPGMTNGQPSTVGLIQSNVVSIAILGVESESVTAVAVSPNPFSNSVTVSGEDAAGRSFKLLSSDGVVVLEGILDGSGTATNMSSLARGLYLLQIQMEGRMEVRKVVKE